MADPASTDAAPTPLSDDEPAASCEIIDQEMFAQILQLDDAEYDHTYSWELYTTFFAQAHHALAEMHDKLLEEDMGALADAAHLLKGSCGQLGVARAAATCGTIEQQCRDEQKVGIGSLLEKLVDHVAVAKGWLVEWYQAHDIDTAIDEAAIPESIQNDSN
jgi:HPt (histidine-containing phosphotransfer) domain-containing protein